MVTRIHAVPGILMLHEESTGFTLQYLAGRMRNYLELADLIKTNPLFDRCFSVRGDAIRTMLFEEACVYAVMVRGSEFGDATVLVRGLHANPVTRVSRQIQAETRFVPGHIDDQQRAVGYQSLLDNLLLLEGRERTDEESVYPVYGALTYAGLLLSDVMTKDQALESATRHFGVRQEEIAQMPTRGFGLDAGE